MDYIKNPMEIENTSMKIIEGEMGEHNFTKEELSIIRELFIQQQILNTKI